MIIFEYGWTFTDFDKMFIKLKSGRSYIDSKYSKYLNSEHNGITIDIDEDVILYGKDFKDILDLHNTLNYNRFDIVYETNMLLIEKGYRSKPIIEKISCEL